MSTQKEDANELCERITAYLTSGGLFNPEMALHERVRDLLTDCRETLCRAASSTKPRGRNGHFAGCENRGTPVTPQNSPCTLCGAASSNTATPAGMELRNEIRRRVNRMLMDGGPHKPSIGDKAADIVMELLAAEPPKGEISK